MIKIKMDMDMDEEGKDPSKKHAHDTDEDEDDEDVPTAEKCMELCETFVEFTETDNAMAMMYLQQNGWDLENALAEFYEARGESAAPQKASRKRKKNSSESITTSLQKNTINLTSVSIPGYSTSSSKPEFTLSDGCGVLTSSDRQHSHLFRVLSWNIDGLSVKSRDFRTEAVVHLIRDELFHIICLQEVVQSTIATITRDLGEYYSFHYPSDISRRDYFPVIGVLNHSGLVVRTPSLKITEFPGSVMQRVVVSLEVKLDPKSLLPSNRKAKTCNQSIQVRIWTSHLESCANFTDERKRQLRQVWSDMSSIVSQVDLSTEPVYGIFCGDMNISDREITDLGGVPRGLDDVWEVTGSRPEARATWDLSRNPNLSLDNPESFATSSNRSTSFRRGLRFDRMYAGGRGMHPVDFELRGLERVPHHSHYPSDHWAILGHFDIY